MKFLKIRRSKIHGTGIFATKAFKKGEKISTITGEIKKKENKTKKDALANACWIGIDKNVWIKPVAPFRYVNHSCNPSAGIRGKITVVALRDLEEDDEVTIDYSISEADPRWYMNCKCAAPNCRKIIRGIQYLPLDIFDQYMPYVPTYFKNFYTSGTTDKMNLMNTESQA